MIEGIISSTVEKVAKTGSPYCTCKLLSPTADPVTINIWGSKASQLPVGKLFHCESPKTSDAGISCNFSQASLSPAPQSFTALLPSPPSHSTWSKCIDTCCHLISDESRSSIFRKASELLYPQFCKGTAARSNHHNYIGGLATHTYELLRNASALIPVSPHPLNSFVIFMGCLFHDAYKLYEYNPDLSYTKYMFLIGHPVGSASMAEAFCNQYSVSPELTLHIKHCVLAHHLNPGNLNWGSPVSPCTLEAFYVAMCDMISGHGEAIAITSSLERCFSSGTNIVKCPI